VVVGVVVVVVVCAIVGIDNKLPIFILF
jgi:hypothetical protein